MSTQYAFGQIVTSGLVLSLDAADKNSYAGSGTVWNDLTSNSNNVTLVNTPTFSSTNGGGLVLNGTNQYATASDSTSLRPSSFSIDAWFRPTSFGSFNTVVVKPAVAAPWSAPFLSYMIRINSTGTALDCSVNTGGTFRTFSTNYTFSTNTTYNACVTFNSSNGFIFSYINGSLLGGAILTAGAITYAAFPLIIGADYGASPVGEYFAGNIYNIKIYNTILAPSSITQNYNAQKSRFGL